MLKASRIRRAHVSLISSRNAKFIDPERSSVSYKATSITILSDPARRAQPGYIALDDASLNLIFELMAEGISVGVPQMGLRPPNGVAKKIQALMLA
ncbi:hypothetical protein KEM48_002222 [Puccinia striiformis f. sp. tritici PST-130]|nr:hypothetical protein KEM48_002222 [Puccinia striiformis f. sp. tritici PST-130]